jgi:hypothetical protein
VSIGTDPGVPSGVSRKPPVVRAPSPGHEPPLVGSACPFERSPCRVASFWLPAPPMTFTRERAGLRGLSRNDLPFAPKNSGPSRGLRPPYRVSDRSLRPTRLRVDSSHGVSVPYDDSRLQVRSTRDCLTRHLPTSGFGYPLAGLLPAHDTDPKIGHRPWGSPFRALYPPASRTRFRAVALMPFPVHPSFSSEDEKVGCSAATPGPCSGRRAVSFREVEPPFRAEPSWVSILSEALAGPR